jgi:hypothetical protein
MSIDVPPPRRRGQPDYAGWPPRPRITAALITLWALLLACPILMLLVGGVWFWEGWERGLRALVASAFFLCLLLLHLLYLVQRENRPMDRRSSRAPRRPF